MLALLLLACFDFPSARASATTGQTLPPGTVAVDTGTTPVDDTALAH